MGVQADIARPADVFEGLHVKHEFLDQYVHNKLSMNPVYRETVQIHLENKICPGRECQAIIDSMVEEDGKRNRAGLPRGDY